MEKQDHVCEQLMLNSSVFDSPISDEALESVGRMTNLEFLGSIAMPTGCGCLSKPTSM